MEPSGAAPRPARSIRLGYEFEFVPQARRWAGRGPAPSGARGGHHDEVYSVSRSHRLTAAAGLTRRWSVSAQLPFVSRSHGHVHHHRGAALNDAWSVSGAGDLLVEARYAFWKTDAGSTWSAGAGGEAPTGLRRARNAKGDAAESGVLPGSGSWDAAFSLLWQRPMGRGGLFASAAGRLNGPGESGYRLGDSVMLHAGGTAPLAGRLLGMLQLNAVARRRDWKGSTREDTSNTGGEALYVTPGLEYAAGGGLALTAAVQLPILQRVNGYQIVAPYGLRTGVGYRFGL